MQRTLGGFVCGAILLVAGRASADPLRHEVALDAGYLTYMNSVGSWGGLYGGFTVRAEFAPSIGIGTGIRYLTGAYLSSWGALEGYGVLFAEPRIGAWSPRMQLELGLSTAHNFDVNENVLAFDSDQRSRPVPGVFYAEIQAAPIRFSFGSVSFAIGSLGIGVPVPNGGSLRVVLNIAELAWRL